MQYGYGQLGLPVDQDKCIDLLRESAGLGHSGAQYQLGCCHPFGQIGLERNKAEAIKWREKAVEGGDVHARYNLGCADFANGDRAAANATLSIVCIRGTQAVRGSSNCMR